MGGQPSKVIDGLWQGGDDVLNNEEWFKTNNVSVVLSVCRDVTDFEFLTRKQVALDDIESAQLLPHLPMCILYIHQARLEGKTVYVHCNAGISRSSTVILSYMMSWFDMTLAESWDLLKKARPAVHPNLGFQGQLRKFQEMDGEGGKKWMQQKLRELTGSADLIEKDRICLEELRKRVPPTGRVTYF